MRYNNSRIILHFAVALSLSVGTLGGCHVPSVVPHVGGDSDAAAVQGEEARYVASLTTLPFSGVYSSHNNGTVKYAVDGNAATAWDSLRNSNPALTLPLTERAILSDLRLKTNAGAEYNVLVSDDGTTWTTAIGNARNTSSSTETKTFRAGTAAKYIRLQFATKGRKASVQVYEVSATGTPESVATPAPTPSIAPTATPTAAPTAEPTTAPVASPIGVSGVYASHNNGTVNYAIDGNAATSWDSLTNANPWLTLPLASRVTLSELKLKTSAGAAYSVQLSDDGTTWATAIGSVSNGSTNIETKVFPAGKAAKYVRLQFTNWPVKVYEVVVTGYAEATPAPAPSATPTPAPTPAPTLTPTPAPTATPTPAPPTGGRAPVTTPLTNIGGMWGTAYQPTNRSTWLAVSPDGSKVAVTWLHNQDSAGAFATTGEPTAYTTIGDPANPGSFTAPQVVGKRMYNYSSTGYMKYNSAHNHPFVAADPNGSFHSFSVPFNANGWAQGMAATGYGYHESGTQPGGTAWSAPALAKLRQVSLGSSLSETTGTYDADGNLHMFGQGHLGLSQGAMAYQRRTRGDTVIDTINLADSYRPSGMYYFGEGAGMVSPTRNAAGKFDMHVAFSWNKQGSAPMYGLYYLKSTNGGTTWTNATGQTMALPLLASNTTAAVVPANLGSGGTYSGSIPGIHGISVTAARSGVPVIVRPVYNSSQTQTQATVYAYTGGRWLSVPVGGLMHYNQAGTGVAINEVTGRVNVVLLDPGSSSAPGRVLLYHMPLSSLVAGSTAWTQEVIASVPNGSSQASSLKVAVVPNTRFVVMFEPNYVNPGRVKPVLLEAPMR